MRPDHGLQAHPHTSAGRRRGSYPLRSSLHAYRLADVAPTTPFYANLTTLHLIPRHRRSDYLDIVLVVGGNGHHVWCTPTGEQRFHRLVPGPIVLYRPADELVIAGSEGVGLTIRQVAFPAADWDTFATFMGLDPTWARANEPPIASLDPGDVSVERPFEVAMKKCWIRLG